jgi:predicted phosphate transport protein (TIGR00153 family)
MSERLLDWLAKRREINVVKMIQDHLSLCTECAEEISNATKKMISGDREGAMLNILRLNSKEKEADVLRGTIMNELSKGEFSPNQRDDLMHLIKRVDMVADYARSAGRSLTLLSMDRYPDKVKEISVIFVEKTLDNVIMLRKSVQSLTVNVTDTMQFGDQVERIEEEVDELHATARGIIKDLPSSVMTPGEFIVLSEFFNALEMVNDSCEDSVDYLRLIVVKLK